MPKLAIRKAEDAPKPSNTSKAIREEQAVYEDFIRSIGSEVGELSIEPGEQTRSVKVRLRRASTRIGVPLEIWEVDGQIYFQSEQPQVKRGRPKKSA